MMKDQDAGAREDPLARGKNKREDPFFFSNRIPVCRRARRRRRAGESHIGFPGTMLKQRQHFRKQEGEQVTFLSMTFIHEYNQEGELTVILNRLNSH